MTLSLTRLVFDVLVIGIASLVLVGRLGAMDWLLDMTNFFRPHIAVVALVFLLLAVGSASWIRIAIAAALFVAAVYPLVVATLPAAPAAAAGNLRVMVANVNGANPEKERFAALVAKDAPDVVIGVEVIRGWRSTIESLPGLGYVTNGPETRRSAVMIASRYPVTAELVELGARANPTEFIGGSMAVRAEVQRPGAARPLVIYGIHPSTTRDARGWVARDYYLEGLARRVSEEPPGTDVIVAGDWNTPYWSPVLTNFFATSGILTTERGPWPPPTRFFREFGAPIALGTPIDRVAVSKEIGVAGIRTSEDFGSDHLAVITDLALP